LLVADSKERKGWTHIPTGIPFGVVVLHASINISKWIVQLVAKQNL
jgi:hypothetical protein